MRRFPLKNIVVPTLLAVASFFVACTASVHTIENADAGAGKKLLNDGSNTDALMEKCPKYCPHCGMEIKVEIK